jgi:hypothetical protein
VLVEGLEHNTSHQFILQGLSPPSISPCWVAVDRELAPLEQWGYLVVGREIPSPSPSPSPFQGNELEGASEAGLSGI